MLDRIIAAAVEAAFLLWRNEYGRDPEASDLADFLRLVAACAGALNSMGPIEGRKSSYTLDNL